MPQPDAPIEPSESGCSIATLVALLRQAELAALIAAHIHHLAARMDRAVTIEEGRVELAKLGEHL